MNITLIIVCLIIFLAALHGYKKGMTRELSGVISWVVTLFVMTLVIMLYTSFYANESKNVIFTIVILGVVVIVNIVVRVFLKTAKVITKLPIIKILDRFLGFLVGIGEGFLIVWLMYVLSESGIFGQLGEIINEDTSRSQILTLIYEYNYLVKIAAGL